MFWTMSIKAEYRNEGFRPLVEVSNAVPGKMWQVSSVDELRRLAEDMPWLRGLAKTSCGDLYVRSGPASVRLGGEDARKYVATRFGSK